MKNLCVCTLLAICLAAAPLALRADGMRVVFNAPFSFVAGTTTFPPGAYQVTESDSRIVFIQAMGRSDTAAVIVYPVGQGTIGSGNVNFVHRGGLYYLNTVQIGDGRTLRLLQPGEK